MKYKGFSLLELMIALAVVAILVSIAYPSYIKFTYKARRAEAQETLMDWANRQEIWRADNVAYNGTAGFEPADTTYFQFAAVTGANSYTLTATAINDQVHDKQGPVVCSTLTLDQAGTRGPDRRCWRQASS